MASELDEEVARMKKEKAAKNLNNAKNHKQSSKRKPKRLTVDEQLDLLIQKGENSRRQKWQRVAKTLKGNTHNDRFQRERIVTVLEMLEGQP